MSDIVNFSSLEEMQAYLKEQNRAYKNTYTNMKESGNLDKIEEGDFVVREDQGLTIIGKITSPLDWYKDKIEGEDYDLEEKEFEEIAHKESVENGFVFGKFYSVLCPEGELGNAPVTVMSKIDEEQFNIILDLIGKGNE
jgi:hypothetical protein